MVVVDNNNKNGRKVAAGTGAGLLIGAALAGGLVYGLTPTTVLPPLVQEDKEQQKDRPTYLVSLATEVENDILRSVYNELKGELERSETRAREAEAQAKWNERLAAAHFSQFLKMRLENYRNAEIKAILEEKIKELLGGMLEMTQKLERSEKDGKTNWKMFMRSETRAREAEPQAKWNGKLATELVKVIEEQAEANRKLEEDYKNIEAADKARMAELLKEVEKYKDKANKLDAIKRCAPASGLAWCANQWIYN